MKMLWVLITVPIAVILGKISIARHEYKCTECGHHFRVKWYWGASLSFHEGDRRMLKCPSCKKPTWCKIEDN